MTLSLRMVLQADSASAKAALDDTTRGIKGVTAATAEQATKSRTAAGAADAEAAAKRRNAQASREVTNANRQAAGATGNLVAQFNDIGMMLAAGQNPLQLAIQQGTQITQVIGPMGAAGAARALGGAFLGMLNPLSLITMGVIGFGAAAVQAFMGAEEEAAGIVEQLDEIRSATAETQTEIEKLRFGVDEGYQVQLLQEQLRLRAEYNQKVAELQGYLSTTTDSIDRQRMSTAGLVAEIQGIVDRNAEINGLLADQQNRSAQLAVLEGIKAQQAGEMAARQAEAAAEAERQHRALVGAYEVYAQTQKEAEALADAAARAGVEATDLSHIQFGNLAAASAEALRIAGNLGIALDVAQRLANLGPQGIGGNDPSGDTYSGRGRGPTQGEIVEIRTAGQFGYRPPPSTKGARGGGGGGASETEKEAKALQELITSLEAEIEALRVQDPIQQEMIKHREALAGATDAERQKVEELIATREREAALMEGAKARAEFFEEIGTNALDALINKGESFNDVLKNMISSLIQAVAQAALFGSRPFGSLFGGKSILSGLFPALGAGKAAGGMVHGPGDGSVDTFLTPTANGEFIVNAQATARNRHLLEAINSGGKVRGYAEGGYVGADSRRMAARGGSALPASIYMDLRGSNGDQAIEEKVRKGAAQMISLYDREGLAVSVQRVSGDPKRRG